MAQHRSHLAGSAFLALGYAGSGLLFLKIYPEIVLLGAIIVVVTGILPNIDKGPDTESGQHFIGFLAAICPLVILSLFPQLRGGGIARVALVVITSFYITQAVVRWSLSRFATHRGVFHSIPAAIIIFEIGYLIFWDLFPKERLFLAGAAFVGFFSHLILDAAANIDLVGNKERRPAVLKIAGPSWQSTLFLYTTMGVLGWFVLKDIYPGLKVSAGVTY